MQPIFLIGYMGCGKSTMGRAVSELTGIPFIDLDNYIERRFHLTVKAIFAERGEEGFRDVERSMLQEVADFEDVIVACGGGTPCFFDNMEYMNQVAETYYLKATPETICSHLKISKGERPLLKGKSPEELHEFVSQQLQDRSKFYEKAQHIIDVNVLDNFDKIDFVVDEILKIRGLKD